MTRRLLISCVLVATLACAPVVHAQQHPSAATSPAKPAKKKTTAKKPDSAKPAATKTAAPAAAGSSPNLLGQYGEWGAYTATAADTPTAASGEFPSRARQIVENRAAVRMAGRALR